jgi:hypothetical protein
MWKKRLTECAAMMIIGDATLALIDPRRHAALWDCGPKPWKSTVSTFVKHPNLTRSIGAAGLLAGLWLAQRQRPCQRNR